MSEYRPSSWVVIKIDGVDPHYRVLGGWSGGYLTGDSWRLNSGIVKADFEEDHWSFYGSSGSCYKCHADRYGLKMSNAYVYNQLKEKYGDDITLLKDQEWVQKGWDWLIDE